MDIPLPVHFLKKLEKSNTHHLNNKPAFNSPSKQDHSLARNEYFP